ncbi:LuxR family transcriptional regulator [Candidatus Phycosocius spiralis]|uniref:LuxR family transcriptional regulator n=1 Tax=Candidatus Phycosocius spiralis TaxID=2815099 RepID=A0ABQ4PX15_9PROT|nr:LuxR family transcriptional regulator [Candidatus Phycosocius spiralis]GIU67475.1 LuxR family transcriptional regulator [Candidatus Phycosocius spiralis]
MTQIQSLTATVLSQLRTARREGELLQILTKYAKECGFGWFQLVPGPHNPMVNPSSLLNLGNFDPAWRQHYASEATCQSDPARRQAILRAGSVKWQRAFATARDPEQRAFVQAARSHGFRDGVTTPVHGPQGCVALMMFAASQTLGLDYDDEEALSHLAMALYQRVRRLTAATVVDRAPMVRLTGRELECLRWVLEGKTNWEIGVLTGVTARTVQFHLGNASRKLGVFNRVQAAVRALLRGDLSVDHLSLAVDEPNVTGHTYPPLNHLTFRPCSKPTPQKRGGQSMMSSRA